MNITCDKCGTRFQIDDSRIRKEGTNVRCSKCDHRFKIFPEQAEEKKQPELVENNEVELEEIIEPPHTQTEESMDEVPVFRIISEKDCPLYAQGDEFKLSGKVFLVPRTKAPCLILARDVMGILNEKKKDPNAVFSCSGCTGIIKFGFKHNRQILPLQKGEKPSNYLGAVVNLLNSFPIFRNLEIREIEDIVHFLRLDKFQEGDIILRKGEPGRNLYIIVTGKIEVVSDDGMTIAIMGSGEVFGEMSLLSGDPVGATIRVLEPATVLYIGSKDFKNVLNELPTLQLNFTRLLARRMAEINSARSEEFASGMTGKLSEMPPAELFQTLNVNQKTGVLTLKLIKESAYLSFREGELVRAKYRELDGETAFYELLKKREGRFKFIPGLPPNEMELPEIGDFMHLLMEGLRKIDEDDKNFLRTMIPNLT